MVLRIRSEKSRCAELTQQRTHSTSLIVNSADADGVSFSAEVFASRESWNHGGFV